MTVASYRLEQHFGGYNLVQTTVKDAAYLPRHLIADEIITWLNGQAVKAVVTVGGRVCWGRLWRGGRIPSS